MRLWNFVDADGADALDEPLLLEYELGAEQRCLENAVELLRKLQVLGAHVLAEVDGEHEFRAGELVQALLDEFVDVVADDFHDGGGLEVADVLDVRDDLVATRLGKQAHVVTLALVAVVAAQVKNAHAPLRGELRIGEVVLCRYDFGFGNMELPMLWIVYDNYFFHDTDFSTKNQRIG